MNFKNISTFAGAVLLCSLFAINVTAAEAPTELVFDRMINGSVESGRIRAFDSANELMWSRDTGSYTAAQLPMVNDLGSNGDHYYYVEDGTIICLDLYTGEMLWTNSDFGGSAISCLYDDAGILYVSGYFGPDIYAVTPDGKTVIDAVTLTPHLFWPYKLEWTDHTQQVMTIYYEGGIDQYEGGGIEYVDVWSLMEDYLGEEYYYDDTCDVPVPDPVYYEHEYEPVYADQYVDEISLYVVNCRESITLRKSPSSSSAEICQIPKGAEVSYQYYGANGFYYVEYNGRGGYAASAYLSENPFTQNLVCQVANCNESITLRTAPDASASEIMQIPKGAFVVYLENMNNGFYKVRYTDCTGYAMAPYLNVM